MGKFFIAIYNLTKKYKIIFFIIVLLLLLFAINNIRKISFIDDFSAVFPQSDKIEIYNEVISNSTILDQIVFNVYQKDTVAEKADPEKLTAVASNFTDSISSLLMPEHVKSITTGAEEDMFFDFFQFFYNNIPFYLDTEDYENLDTLLLYKNIEEKMRNNYMSLVSPTSIFTSNLLLYDPLSIVLPKLELLRDIQIEDELDLYNGFLITENRRNVLFFALPSDAHGTTDNEYFVSTLERIKENLEREYPGIKIDFYGSVPVAIANTRQIREDIKLTVSIALVLLVFLMLFFFQRLRNILLIFLPAFIGGIIALFAFSFFKPEISALSLAIGSVLLGITVDFSLHFLTHHKHSGLTKKTLKDVSEPIIMSGFTTTSAFLCLIFISSPALRDLGIFAAIAVIGAAIGALLFIPHFSKTKKSTDKKLYKHTFIEKFASFEFHKIKPLLFAILVLSCIFIYFTQFTEFEEDIEKSGYISDELASADKRLKEITDITETTTFVISKGEDLEESLNNNVKIINELQDLKESSVFDSYSSIHRLIPSKKMQAEKIDRWNAFWTEDRIKKTKNNIIKAGSKFDFNEKAYAGFFEMIDKEYETTDPYVLTNKLGLLSENFIITTKDKTLVANLIKGKDDDISEYLNTTFDENPNVLVFNRKSFTENLFEILKKDFNKFIAVSLTVVFLIILLFFGRIELAVITFFPMLLSWIWTIGVMGMFDIKFNIFNIIISAFIFGLGIDYSIFVTKGLLQKYKYSSPNIISYKSSILISCISTLIGVGVLILAKHPALKSIALLSIIGISSVVFLAFTLQPFIFNKLFYHKGKPRKSPVNIRQLAVSTFGFSLFGLTAIALSAFAHFLRIIPYKKRAKKHFFRYLVFLSCKLIICISWLYTPKRSYEIDKSIFKNPSIIISNHQSVMDLLLFLSMSPKIVLLVKGWVWDNFFMGQIVKYSGFINIEKKYEETLPALKESIERGNSILIFPEGTRTRSGKIRRFHKGAFYFAEQLKTDITAIMLHGYYEVLPPGYFIVQSYPVNICKLGRYKYNELGSNYSERAKAMCKLYRSDYEKIKEKHRNTTFYKKEIINKYKFKGPIIEFYVKIKLRLEQNYRLINDIIPKQGEILDLGCGMGILTNMLSLTSEKRFIKGIDYDDDKITLAKNTISENQKNIEFECADLINYEPSFYDVFILYDVLHYIPSKYQKTLIEKYIEKLNPNGMIIIREGDKDLKKKHFMTKVSEFFSTKLGFNKTKDKLSFISGTMIDDIAKENNMELEIIDCLKGTSNQIFVMRPSPTS